jgi:hypothetical protein
MGVSVVIWGGFLLGIGSTSSKVCRYHVDDEQGRGALGLGMHLYGDNLKFPVPVVSSQVVPGGVSLSGGDRRWLGVGHHVADGTPPDTVTPGGLGEPDLHLIYFV